MHNVKYFLEDTACVSLSTPPSIPFLSHPNPTPQKCSFQSSQEARARATAEGNLKPDDLIDIYRKRTTIDNSGKETVARLTYFVVDSVEALSTFGTDAWERVVCDDDGAGVAVWAV